MLEKIGENLEYVQTWVDAKIEIEKIELTQHISKLLSWILMRLMLGVLACLIFFGLIGMLTLFLSQLFHSFYVGMGLVIAILILLAIIIKWYYIRILRRSLAKKMYRLIENKQL